MLNLQLDMDRCPCSILEIDLCGLEVHHSIIFATMYLLLDEQHHIPHYVNIKRPFVYDHKLFVKVLTKIPIDYHNPQVHIVVLAFLISECEYHQ